MSSSASVTLDSDAQPVSLAEWQELCITEGISYSPQTIGQNVYYKDEVELSFGSSSGKELPLVNGSYDFSQAEPPKEAHKITVSTYFMGHQLEEVARLALVIWGRFGGQLDAAPELRALVAPTPVVEQEAESDAESHPSGPRARISALSERS